MTGTSLQAKRIRGEHQHSSAAASPVVDRYYRLQPADIGGPDSPPRVFVVRQVGEQGFEQPLPLLYLTGLAKPLLLDATNVGALTHIAASPLQRDWIERDVVLAVVPENGAATIRIYAPGDPVLLKLWRRSQRIARTHAAAMLLHRAFNLALFLVALLIFAGIAYYLVENWATLVELGTTLIDNLLNS